MMLLRKLITLGMLAMAALASAADGLPSTPVSLNIPKQPLSDALNEFARQTKLRVAFYSKESDGLTSPPLSGNYTPQEALTKLLANTSLTYSVIDSGTVAVMSKEKTGRSKEIARSPALLKLAQADMAAADEGPSPVARADEGADDKKTADASRKGIPEMLVRGSRSTNTDIRRTEDDVQPYVVFDAEDIQRSMALNLEGFLKTRLPMNQSRNSEGQNLAGVRGNQSSIDLRGLGPRQTLILVDGRRMPGVSSGNDFDQADINGIPLSAVERIEVLPSTAGGIYGGGATGGVVNIILKRDFNDVQMTARYDGTFDGGGSQRQLDATAGFSLEDGRTHVAAIASYRDGQPLHIGDRDFLARSYALQDQNNHAFFYTSPQLPRGYTTNIRSANGSNLVLVNGMRSLNSPIASVPVGYAGPSSDNGAAFLGTADRFNLNVPNDALGNGYSLLNTPEVKSLQLSLRRQFTDSIDAFVDASRYDNSTSRTGFNSDVLSVTNVTLPVGPNNPFTQAVILSVPIVGYDADRLRMDSRSLTQQLTGGVIMRLPRQWMVQGEYSRSWSDFDYVFPGKLLTADGAAAIRDGRLNPLSDVNAYPINYSAYYPIDPVGVAQQRPVDQKDASLRISGPLWNLPGGPLRLAALLERREQYSAASGTRQGATDGDRVYVAFQSAGATTDSAYMELNAPLVSAANARPGLFSLDLLASYRNDDTKTRTWYSSESNPDYAYRTEQTSGNQYTLGVGYSPVRSLMLRVSYGRGILPPSPNQASQYDLGGFWASLFLNGLIDPKRGGSLLDTSAIDTFAISGGVPLRPELSSSWSAGMILTPEAVPGLRLSVDYTRIEKTDEIGTLDNQTKLNLEDDLPGVIVRNELTPADAALGYTAGTVRQFSGGMVNIAKSLMEAFDIQADYVWDTRLGSFAANLMLSVQPHLSMQAAPGSQEIDRVGYADGPLKWRGNAGLRWSRGAWDLGWNTQYYDAYRIYATVDTFYGPTRVLNQGGAWVPDQTYHDVYGRYRFQNASGTLGSLLADTDVQVSVQNVLNTSPPILTTIYYFPSSGYANEGDPRLRRYSVSFTKRFGR